MCYILFGYFLLCLTLAAFGQWIGDRTKCFESFMLRKTQSPSRYKVGKSKNGSTEMLFQD